VVAWSKRYRMYFPFEVSGKCRKNRIDFLRSNKLAHDGFIFVEQNYALHAYFVREHVLAVCKVGARACKIWWVMCGQSEQYMNEKKEWARYTSLFFFLGR
jgi:hypothetical protein